MNGKGKGLKCLNCECKMNIDYAGEDSGSEWQVTCPSCGCIEQNGKVVFRGVPYRC
jgi:hypothetical protein